MGRLKTRSSEDGKIFTSEVHKLTVLPVDGVHANVVYGFFSMLIRCWISTARIRFAASAGELETATLRCGSHIASWFFKKFFLVNH